MPTSNNAINYACVYSSGLMRRLSGLTLLTSHPVLPCTLCCHSHALYICCRFLAYCMCEHTTFVCFHTLFVFPATVMHTRSIPAMCMLVTTWIGVGTFDQMTVTPVHLCISCCDHLPFLGEQQCSQLFVCCMVNCNHNFCYCHMWCCRNSATLLPALMTWLKSTVMDVGRLQTQWCEVASSLLWARALVHILSIMATLNCIGIIRYLDGILMWSDVLHGLNLISHIYTSMQAPSCSTGDVPTC